MRTCIASSVDFSYEAELKPIEALPGQYNLEILSTWQGAKDGRANRRVLQICLDAAGVDALRSILKTEGAGE